MADTATIEPALVLNAGEDKPIGDATQDIISRLDHGVKTVNCERFRNCFFFSVTIRRWGNRSKVKDLGKYGDYIAQLRAEIEAAEANGQTARAVASLGSVEGSKTTSVSKILMHSDPLDALNDFLTATKDRLCGRFGVAMPSRIKEGLFVVPAAKVEDFERDLKEAVSRLRGPFTQKDGTQHPGYVPAFLADYQAGQNRARDSKLLEGGLGPLFEPSDYPPASEVGNLFSLEWGWLALSVPEGLPESVKAEAKQRFDAQIAEAAQEVKDALYTQLGELLEHATDKLTVQPGEKPKVFRDSMIANIQQFCDVFQSRNLWNDTQLETLVNRAKEVLTGMDPDKLRKYASVRENARAKFAEIKTQLDQAIVTQRGRFVDLSEE